MPGEKLIHRQTDRQTAFDRLIVRPNGYTISAEPAELKIEVNSVIFLNSTESIPPNRLLDIRHAHERKPIGVIMCAI